MLQLIVSIAFLLASILLMADVRVAAAAESFPSRLHSSATLYMNNKNKQEGIVPGPSGSIDLYQVDEYVDLSSNKSSLSVVDLTLNQQKIYYNQFGPEQSDKRQFVVYDPLESTCSHQPLDSWPLARLRQIATRLQDSAPGVNRPHHDVSIGPSALLYAIMDNPNSFQFNAGRVSEWRQTFAAVYERRLTVQTLNGWNVVRVKVQVATSVRAPPYGDPLRQLDRRSSANDTKMIKTFPDIVQVGACLASKFDDLDDAELNLKELHPKQAQIEEDFCGRDTLLFVVDYHTVSEYTPGTLVGKSLEDFGQGTGYNFQQEPFVRPVGIGCWDSSANEPNWQKSSSRDSPINKFTAQYVSLYGRPGVSFVAYDGHRRLLRLDWEGRKNIYDLGQSVSYHINEYYRPSLAQGGSESAEDKRPEQCIVLSGTVLADSTIRFRMDDVEQLIGFNRDEHYLGSRMLDHIPYDVFEKELKSELGEFKLPRVLQVLKSPSSRSAENKRLFITYYAQTGQSRITVGQNDKELPIVSFVEVWELNTVSRKKWLVNRVKFLEFSWELDIEPTDDGESQKQGAVGMQLFEMESCYEDRSAQGELVVRFREQFPGKTDETRLARLRSNFHLVSEQVHAILSNLMGISQLNLVDQRLQILDTGNLLSTNRIVELCASVLDIALLGLMRYQAEDSASYVLKTLPNRYSLDECKLDSISDGSSDCFAYCPKLSVCLLLSQNKQLKSTMTADNDANRLVTQKSGSDICQVHTLRHTAPQTSHFTALSRAHWIPEPNELSPRYVDIHIPGADTHKYTVQPVALKQLDPIGARLRNDAALLSGLRYSTMEEDPSSFNLNERVRVSAKRDALRYCQLACQIDQLCGSFSVCSRSVKSGEQDDCVLSSVRLTGERLNNMMSASVENKESNEFEIKVTDEHHSQSLIMYRDHLCSLHPKDFLAEYHLDRILDAADLKQAGAAKAELEKRHLDLEDCAGLNFERSLLESPKQREFTYCPLDSHCIVSGDDYSSQMAIRGKYCHVYTEFPIRSYVMEPEARIVITPLGVGTDDQPKSSSGEEQKKTAAKTLLELKNHLEESSSGETEQLTGMFWGVSEDGCARLCNARKSKCLAFDSCRQDSVFLCILHHVRSPRVKQSAYLPLLEREKDILAKFKVELGLTEVCSHYHLNEAHFELRLNTMLSDEQYLGSAMYVNEVRQQIIGKLGDMTIREDRKQSDEARDSLVQQLARHDLRDGPHVSQAVHFISLLAGLFVGALGFVCLKLITSEINHHYHTHEGRSVHANDLLNQLALDVRNG